MRHIAPSVNDPVDLGTMQSISNVNIVTLHCDIAPSVNTA